MANVVSMLSTGRLEADITRAEKDSIHTSMLNLNELIKGRKYLENYSEAMNCISNIYFTSTKYDQGLISLFKKRFQNGLTRGVYALILQDITDIILKDDFTTEFTKYDSLVEDNDDIKLNNNDYSDIIEAFNTKIDIKVPASYEVATLNKVDELNIILRKLGVDGTLYLMNALYKVVVVSNK